MTGISLGDLWRKYQDWRGGPSLSDQLGTAFPQPLDAGRPGQTVAQAAPPPTSLTPEQWNVLGALNFAAPIKGEPPLPVWHATDAAGDLGALRPGRRGAVYFSETERGAQVGAAAGARERALTGGGSGQTRLVPAEISGEVAYRDPPPAFEFPEHLTGSDGYYDTGIEAKLKDKIAKFSHPSLSDEETDFARQYLTKYLDNKYDNVTGSPQKIINQPRYMPAPDYTEFEHGLGARERGYMDGTFSVVGARTPPQTIRNALRALGYPTSLVSDESGNAIAAYPMMPGGKIEAARFLPGQGIQVGR